MRHLLLVDTATRRRFVLKLAPADFEQLRVWLSSGRDEDFLHDVLTTQRVPLLSLFASDPGSWRIWLFVAIPVLFAYHFIAKKWPHPSILTISSVLSVGIGLILSAFAWVSQNTLFAAFTVFVSATHVVANSRTKHLVRNIKVPAANRFGPIVFIASIFMVTFSAALWTGYSSTPTELPVTDADMTRAFRITDISSAHDGNEYWQKWQSSGGEYLEYSFVANNEETPMLASISYSARGDEHADVLFSMYQAGLWTPNR